MLKMYTPTIIKALNLAYTAHHGQFDKLGVPYIEHVLAVAGHDLMETEDDIVAALLHDVIEDTGITASQIVDHGFSESAVATVSLLTKSKGENYVAYIDDILRSGNETVIKVKIADLEHNLQPHRLSMLPQETRERLESKYVTVKGMLEYMLHLRLRRATL